MRVKALRGVCVGVGRDLKPGDSADLDTAMVTFLVGIKAVEIVKDEPTQPVHEEEKKPEEQKQADEKKAVSDEKPKGKKEK